ncbi:MAG: hypothetical protein J7527_00500, partial [Chitinophagaceae bacterium]|nr:hypothetical protein [Chitinophagaceae bacterium]
LMLAGFITDSSKVISPATTAKVLLHWGLMFPFQPQKITRAYVNNIDKIIAAREWIAKFEALYKADPYIMSKKGFTSDLKIAVEKIRDQRRNDINAKNASDIQVDANDIKSGLQVLEDGLSKLSINNKFRRRAYAYLYKMSYKDLDGNFKPVLSSITQGSSPDNSFPVAAVSGVTSVLGEIGKYIEDNAIQSFVAKTGPLDLSLNENESEARYKLRIVGPGFGNAFMTTLEQMKQEDLIAETLAMDVAIPFMALITSVKGLGTPPDPQATALSTLVDVVKAQLKSIPDVWEEAKKGDYKAALTKLIENFGKDVGGALLSEFCVTLGQLYDLDPDDAFFGSMSKLNGIMGTFDVVLGSLDIYRISADVAASKPADEWDVVARSSKVSLSPKESVTVPSGQTAITATIKNLQTSPDTHPFFVWFTSGKYGRIKDSRGNQGDTVRSADKNITYTCTASSSALTNGDNWEYVYVRAYYADQLIGTDTMKINVRKLKYKMKPDNITLSGKKDGTRPHNSVELYLLRTDNVNNIKPNPDNDYKVVWSTAGKYGVLSTTETEGTTATTYDLNSVAYECTDDQTKEATETIKARIYVKAKSEADYHLLDEVTGTVKIDNDDKKKIIEVPLTYMSGCWTEGNCYTYPVAVFQMEDSAKKYKVMFYNFTGTSVNAPEGETFSWNKGQHPPTYYSTYYSTYDINGGNYYISLGRTWCAGPTNGCNMGNTGTWEARYRELYGTAVRAEVTYYY